MTFTELYSWLSFRVKIFNVSIDNKVFVGHNSSMIILGLNTSEKFPMSGLNIY